MGRRWQAEGVTDTASRVPWRLLVLAPIDDSAVSALVGDLPVEPTRATGTDAAALRAALADAELVVGDWRIASAGLDAAAVESAPRLALVLQPSVGVQAHDADALASAGVPLANAPGFNTASVAEWAIGALLSALRELRWAEDELRAGQWPPPITTAQVPGELAGRRVGIVGFGAIGQAVAVRLAAFGCPVSYWSRHRRTGEQEHGARYVDDVDALVAEADVLVNAVALAPTTRGLIGPDRLASLPRGAVVVNASRGGIVDEPALARLLHEGHLAAAALDVFADEPLPADSPLRSAPRCLLTPHVAGSTPQAQRRLVGAIVAGLHAAVAGEPVAGVVNGVDPVVRRRT